MVCRPVTGRKARYELPPGIVLLQISLLFLYLSSGPLRPSKIVQTLPGIVPFRPRSLAFTFWRTSGLFPAPMCLLPEAPGVATDTPASGSGVGDVSLYA